MARLAQWLGYGLPDGGLAHCCDLRLSKSKGWSRLPLRRNKANVDAPGRTRGDLAERARVARVARVGG